MMALVGNPNCGKTTLFNRLTGSHYEVGNRMGVTVYEKVGICKMNGAKIVDLPGIYSLHDYASEEAVAGDYLKNHTIDVIINIVDATNLERNLLLTTELLELGTPVIVALNMTDLLEQRGISVDCSKLSAFLGVPVIPISASKNKGLHTLCSCQPQPQPKRHFSPRQRRDFIKNAVTQSTVNIGENQNLSRTRKLDSIFLHPAFSIPILLLVLFLIFHMTFGPLTTWVSAQLNVFINLHFSGTLVRILTTLHTQPILIKFIEGILQTLGNVLSFLPQITVLFGCLAILEDSGYLARTVFILDGVFQKFGLSGKAVLPLLLGFGCTVPAAMATRTLSDSREQRLVLTLLPFMSCSAKMPIYVVFAGTFFPECAGLVVFGLYIFGVLLALTLSALLSKCRPWNTSAPFILELPPYRVPTLQTVFSHIFEKLGEFIKKAGTTLFLASLGVWLLQNFNWHLEFTPSGESSMLGCLGKAIAPIFVPCGFGNWQSAVSLLTGLFSKEAVVSTLSILCSASTTHALSQALPELFSPAAAVSFMVFVLFYTPCISATCTMANEFGSLRLAVRSAVICLVVAWVLAYLVFQIGSLFL